MKLEITQQGAIAQLKDFFSHKSVFLSEALQNSRRAGASYFRVDVQPSQVLKGGVDIEFTDDGHGFASTDWDALLKIFKSGWHKDLAEAEYAYGFGFASLIFACENLLIASNNYAWLIDTAAATRGEELGEPSVTNTDLKGTIIKLRGVDIDADTIEKQYRRLAWTSSLPIFMGTEQLPNDYAKENLEDLGYQHFDTELGALYINWQQLLSFDSYSGHRPYRSPKDEKSLAIICQENKVHGNNLTAYAKPPAFLFANNELRARLPDRTSLIDRDESLKKVGAIYKRLLPVQLDIERKAMSNDAQFVEQFYPWLNRYAPELFNAIDVLPVSFFEPIAQLDLTEADDVVVADREDARDAIGKDVVSKNDDLFIVEPADTNQDEVLKYTYFAQLKALAFVGSIPKEHWLHEKMKSMDVPVDVRISGVNSDVFLEFYTPGTTAERIELEADGYPVVELTDMPLVLPEHFYCRDIMFDDETTLFDRLSKTLGADFPCVYIPMALLESSKTHDDLRVIAEDILAQQDSFCDEWGEFLETKFDEHRQNALADLKALCGMGLDEEIQRVLEELPLQFRQSLADKQVSISVDDNSKVSVSVSDKAA